MATAEKCLTFKISSTPQAKHALGFSETLAYAVIGTPPTGCSQTLGEATALAKSGTKFQVYH